MSIDTGKGYRIYYAQKGKTVYLLLNGGDKTTQSIDIQTAKTLWFTLQQNPIKEHK